MIHVACAIALIVSGSTLSATPDAAQDQHIGINIVLKCAATDALLADLGRHGEVLEVMPQIKAVMLKVDGAELSAIRALPYVESAGPDQKRYSAGLKVHRSIADFSGGGNAWNLDAINVTNYGAGRTVAYDGEGVYVAIVDDGLPHNWRQVLPEDQVDTVHARSFAGGGGEHGSVSSQPDLWEHCSKDGHGIGCASIVLGYRFLWDVLPMPGVFNGVAPKAKVIPINIFHNSEFYWSSVISRAILYVADLKASGELGSSPVVINLSNGGLEPEPVERAAIDYAIDHGVVVVAAAGNEAVAGMRYPAQYPEVISAAATGNVNQFPSDDPTTYAWVVRDIAESDPLAHFVASFSAHALPGQDLDVAAPGYCVPVPWAEQNGHIDYSFFFGTSAAAPHVAGVVALMLQKNPSLTAAQIESILEATAMPLPPGSRSVTDGFAGHGNTPTWSDHSNVFEVPNTHSWGTNATGSGLVQADAALAATP